MSNASEIADKLDEARALIEKGWLQHIFHSDEDGSDCYCTTGAVAQVTAGTYYADAIHGCYPFDASIGLLSKAAGTDPSWIALSDWNDAKERTQAEVIEAFRKAAELARAGAVA